MNVLLMFLERKLSLSVCCCIVLTQYAECTSVVSSSAIRYFHTEQSQPVCKTDLFNSSGMTWMGQNIAPATKQC